MKIKSAFGFLLALVALINAPLRAADVPLAVDYTRSHIDLVANRGHRGTFTGHVEKYNAQFAANAALDKITSAAITFQLADAHSDKPNRDKKVLKWVHADKFPEAAYTLRQFLRDGQKITAVGALVLNGKSLVVTFPVTITANSGSFVIDGTATIDTREWDLGVMHSFGIFTKVEPVMNVDFHFELARQG